MWALTVGEWRIALWDLPISLLAQAADGKWWSVVWNPFYDLTVAERLLRLAAQMRGVELPEPLTVRDVLESYSPAEDDLPDYWEGHVPHGGRDEDLWIGLFCRPPHSFTPRQVREDFTVRDLQLIDAASGAATF